MFLGANVSVEAVEVKGEDVYSLAPVLNRIGFEGLFIARDVDIEVLDRYCQIIFNPPIVNYVRHGLRVICSSMLSDWLKVNEHVKAIGDSIKAELFNPIEKLARLGEALRRRARTCELIRRSKVNIGFYSDGKVLTIVLSVSTFKDPYSVVMFTGETDLAEKAKEKFTQKLSEFKRNRPEIRAFWFEESALI